jgi:hypothetical protein
LKNCDLYAFKCKLTHENETTAILEIAGNHIPSYRGQGNEVGKGLDCRLGFISWTEIFSSADISILDLGCTQLHIQLIAWFFSCGKVAGV